MNRAAPQGDAISARLRRRRLEAERLCSRIQSGRLNASRLRLAHRKMEEVAMDADLLWDVRMCMLQAHPPSNGGPRRKK